VIKERENLDRADCVVVEITGSGLKDPNVATKGMPEIPVIDASMQELDRVLKL
jgi:threonine synthase